MDLGAAPRHRRTPRLRPLVGAGLVGVLVVTGAAVARTAVRAPAGGFPPYGVASPATVELLGRPGTFGVTGDTLPSGQRLSRRAVPDWGRVAGVQAAQVAVAADGTVLIAGRSTEPEIVVPSAGELAIGAYQPATNRYETVRLRTDKDRDRVRDPQGGPAAPSITALEPVAGGQAVVFVAGHGLFGQNFAAEGAWPVFGLLTKVDGRWQVARGDGWTNQWTGRQLRETGGAEAESACPARATGATVGANGDTGGAESNCGGLYDLAVLPQSRDLIAVQRDGGGLVAMRLTEPGPDGRVDTRVVKHFPSPQVRVSGVVGGAPLPISAQRVSVDPTSVRGDERFVVTFRVPDPNGKPLTPSVIQEFSYNADTGTIRPVSAPLLAGDADRAKKLFGFDATLYDRNGNLWVARVDGEQGLGAGKLAVYTKDAGRKRLTGKECGPVARPVTQGAKGPAWGRSCPPDFNIGQSLPLGGSHGLIEDPATGAIVSLNWGGILHAVLPSGSGTAMTFRMGNPLDLGRGLLPSRAQGVPVGWLGGYDATGRLWTSAATLQTKVPDASIDQYLYSIDVGDLFEDDPVVLPRAPGRRVIVQAEQTVTRGSKQSAGENGSVEVNANAYFTLCDDYGSSDGCGYDGVPGNGFRLGDKTGFGVIDGMVEYRVHAETAGTFRLYYRVSTYTVTPNVSITATVADQKSTTPVRTDAAWLTVEATVPITLPAGTHTLRLTSGQGGNGWILNHLVFQRV